MAGEDARLTFGIDASGAQQGARQFVDASKQVEKGATDAAKGVDTLEKRTASVGKQFGLAKGPLKEFGQIGASVFAGDILAKALGFSNVLGAVNTATGLAAEGVSKLAVVLRDELFPSWTEQLREQEAFRESLEKTRSQIATVRDALRGRGVNSVGPGGRQSFISTAGLDLENELKVLIAVEAANKRIQDAIKRNAQIEADRRKASTSSLGIAGPLAGEQLVDTSKMYVEQTADLFTMTAQLQKAVSLEQDRLAITRKMNEERDRALASQPFIVQNDYTVPNGPDPYANVYPEVLGPENLKPFGPENGPTGTINRYDRTGGASPFAKAIADALTTAATKLPDVTNKTIAWAKAQAQVQQEMERVQRLSDGIGFTLASGFEEAIFSGQKLSDVLRQLALDLARLVFRETVTNQLGSFFSGAIKSGFGGGGQEPFTNGSGPILPPGGSTNHPLAAGGIGGGFRLSGRQARENVARSF